MRLTPAVKVGLAITGLIAASMTVGFLSSAWPDVMTRVGTIVIGAGAVGGATVWALVR